MSDYPYATRVQFVVELATRLHNYGTTAQRLEAATVAVATRLGLRCEPWSNPTGLILSFSDRGQSNPLDNTTQVIRLAPGDVDLSKLCKVDAIAEDVLSGKLSIDDAIGALHQLDVPGSRTEQLLSLASFGLTSAAVAILFRGAWLDAAVSGVIGLLIGVLYALGGGRPRFSESLELLAALMATVLAAAVATFIVPLSLKTVVVASLVVLLPGMMLTNAVSELTSQQLVAGTARFSGAIATLLKLAFGSMVGTQLVALLNWVPLAASAAMPMPEWATWLAVFAAAVSFAVLFKAAWRDFPLVIVTIFIAYVAMRAAGVWLTGSAPVFVGSVLITVIGNAYARWANRPGALIRVPGILLMVPGSVGFRGISSMFELDIGLGMDIAVNVAIILVALVGGMLIGNVLVPARREL